MLRGTIRRESVSKAESNDTSGVSRRTFLQRAVAALGGVVGFTALGTRFAARAEAATLTIFPTQSAICQSGGTCHGGTSYNSGCCSGPGFAQDKWHVKRNNTGSPQVCSGTTGGPCCGQPKQCYGGVKWWMSPYYSKWCCAVS